MTRPESAHRSNEPAVDGGDELTNILSGFAREITTRDNPRERVAVEVTRRSGFQNSARSTGGLEILLDEPVAFGGRGEAFDPAEYLLAAAGASLAVTLTAHAALRGLRLDEVRVVLSGDIDGRLFFHPEGEGSAGLLETVVDLSVKGPMSRSTFSALLRDAWRVAPVIRSLNKLPRLRVKFERTR